MFDLWCHGALQRHTVDGTRGLGEGAASHQGSRCLFFRDGRGRGEPWRVSHSNIQLTRSFFGGGLLRRISVQQHSPHYSDSKTNGWGAPVTAESSNPDRRRVGVGGKVLGPGTSVTPENGKGAPRLSFEPAPEPSPVYQVLARISSCSQPILR